MDEKTVVTVTARQALEAGAIVLHDRFQQPTTVSDKTGNEITIPEDRLAEAAILEVIAQMFPNDHVHSEEAGEIAGETERQWIIDPLDGTTNYAAGIPFVDTQLAVLEHGRPVHSAVYDPFANEYFAASLNQGTTNNAKPINLAQAQRELRLATVSIGKGSQHVHMEWWAKTVDTLAPQTRHIRLYGATGLELAYVAAGRLDLHLNYGSKIMDFAPGALLIREAGGVAWNFTGDDWQPGDDSLIAGNEQIVAQAPKLLE